MTIFASLDTERPYDSRLQRAPHDVEHLRVAAGERRTVDEERLARDPRRVVGGEERGRGGDVLGRTDASHRDVLEIALAEEGEVALVLRERRVDQPRSDA